MATWDEMAAAAPDLADAVRALFDAHRHKTLATIRRDGSPRISGIEAVFINGELWFGGYTDSLKIRDLRRDPRFALHSGTAEPDYAGETAPVWPGDAKVAGRAVEVTDPATIEAATGRTFEPGQHSQFKADLTEVVLTHLGDPPDHLLIEFWREGEAVRRVERR